MNVVYKYPLHFGPNVIEMPKSAGPVLAIGVQSNKPVMWVLIEDDEVSEIWPRRFYVVMTGEQFKMNSMDHYAGCEFKHCGSFQISGPTVGHVFEAVSP